MRPSRSLRSHWSWAVFDRDSTGENHHPILTLRTIQSCTQLATVGEKLWIKVRVQSRHFQRVPVSYQSRSIGTPLTLRDPNLVPVLFLPPLPRITNLPHGRRCPPPIT
jgi:hypothetical protein